jgi:hypothetical protein
LHAEVSKAVAATAQRNRLLEIGIELAASASTAEFAAFLRKQTDAFAILARQTGMAEK